MTVKTYPYDTAEFLGSDEDIALFAEAVLEDGDPSMFRRALDAVARAHGFAQLAEKAGIPRREFFKALLDPEIDGGTAVRAALEAASLGVRREAAE